MTLLKIKKEISQLANPRQAKILSRFFKTGPGEYGEGDIFLGIKVPVQRTVVKKFRELPLKDTVALLRSRIHEHRLIALLILVDQYKKSEPLIQKKIYEVYLKNTDKINNWDLVDLTAPNIVGAYLIDKSRQPLYHLARSKSLWERRIAILATLAFIRHYDFKDALALAKILLHDSHDLIHKAVGWMLRELGKRNHAVEEKFLLQVVGLKEFYV